MRDFWIFSCLPSAVQGPWLPGIIEAHHPLSHSHFISSYLYFTRGMRPH
jgi:hypothetical protein